MAAYRVAWSCLSRRSAAANVGFTSCSGIGVAFLPVGATAPSICSRPRLGLGRSCSAAGFGALREDLESAQERLALIGSGISIGLEAELRKEFGLGPQIKAAPSLQSSARRPSTGKEGVDPMRLFHQLSTDTLKCPVLDADTVKALIDQAADLLEGLPGPLIHVQVPQVGKDPKVVVVGDTHGQLMDVLHIMHAQHPPDDSIIYVFNGDIADRGRQAVEIWILLLSFMLRSPGQVCILRGNHENGHLNERSAAFGGGFAEECLQKYNKSVYESFKRLFMLLPLFAVIQNEVFVVHAGLFRRSGVTLEQLQALPYKRQYPLPPRAGDPAKDLPNWGWSEEATMLFDAQWADPQPAPGIGPSKRGAQCMSFGPDVTEAFLKRNDLSLCVRSHQVPRSGDGFELSHNNQLLTVFSASNYGRSGNRGAIAIVRAKTADANRGCAEDLSSFSLNVPTLRGLRIECVEHDLLGGMHWLRSAQAVAQVAKARRGVADEAAQHVLCLICIEVEELWSRCHGLDQNGSRRLPKAVLLQQLEEVCGEFAWENLLKHCGVELNSDVDYPQLFNSIRIRWLHLSTCQAHSLASAMLEAELHVEGLLGVLDANRDGQVSPDDIHRALKHLLPGASFTELHRVSQLFLVDGESLDLGQFIDKLLFFTPPLNLPESWMQEALLHLGNLIEAWAERQAPAKIYPSLKGAVHGSQASGSGKRCSALLQWFSAHDVDADGFLAVTEVVDGLKSLQASCAVGENTGAAHPCSSGLLESTSQLFALAEALDSNASNSISFLEMAKALQQPCEKETATDFNTVVLDTQCSCTALIFLHRDAVLHGCRLIDSNASGFVSPSEFTSVVRALGGVTGRRPSEKQLEALVRELGSGEVDYASALNSFEISVQLSKPS